MFLVVPFAACDGGGFPRVRGDVPWIRDRLGEAFSFSPRARGCSLFVNPPIIPERGFPRVRGDVPPPPPRRWWICPVFPACAGMFPAATPATIRTFCVFPACAGMFRGKWVRAGQRPCFPRVRGDVPAFMNTRNHKDLFSPRARGCSCFYPASHHVGNVFPACAGMFRTGAGPRACTRCFPRVRGDVP